MTDADNSRPAVVSMPPKAGPERLGYRPREIARLTGLAPATIYKWIENGEIKAGRTGRALIVPAEEVRRILGADAA